VDTKRCGKCGDTKPITDFSLNKGKGDGHHYWCKLCANEYNRMRNQRVYTEAFIRAKNLKQLYGMSSEDYQLIFLAQNGVCAACGQPETAIDHRTKQVKNLQIDHCHTTGRVRALLCKECNNALGLLHDDKERIRLLLRYVEFHNSVESERKEGAEL
jgi:peptide methionine sulfoxide reductase MsrB